MDKNNLPIYIDANGFVHFMAYAEASDGVTASTINSDYVSLDVTLNAGGNKANLVTWVPVGNAWDNSITSNTSNAPTKSSVNVPSSAIASRLDSNGFVHFLAYADPSNGIAASQIFTDYIELEVVVWENILVDSPWNFHDNAQLVDAETMVLNATGNYQTTLIMVPAKGGDTVTFSLGEGSTSGAYLQLTPKNSSQAGILSPTVVYAGQSKTVTAPVGTVQWDVSLSNNQGAKQYIFKQPMLNLGSTPAPYERKKGTRMVMPIFKNNLIDTNPISWIQGTQVNPNDMTIVWLPRFIDVLPNTTYTISVSSGYKIGFDEINNTVTDVRSNTGNVVWNSYSQTKTFTTSPTTAKIRLFVQKNNSSSIVVSDIATAFPQLEVGSAIMSNVQINNKVKKLVPKKNLFNKNTVTKGYSLTGIGTSNVNVTFSYSDYISVKPNTTYYKTATNGGEFYDLNKVVISAIPSGTNTNTFTTPSNCYFMRMNVLLDSLDSYQLEEGSVATPYEPYTQVLPKAPQGLRFNGVTDFIQGAYLPSIEFTKSFALEGEFMIDRIPTIGTHALFQNSNASSRIALSVTTQGHLSLSYFDGTIWTGKSGIVPLNQRVKYLATCTNGVLTMSINGVDQTGTSTGYSGIDSSRFTIGQATTNQSNNSFLGIMYSFKATDLIANQTLLNYDFTNPNNIVGNTVLPVGKSITGMNFNGTSDYLQIPALTMDAIEIDCVIDSSQSASAMFLDARNGLSNGHITIDGNGGGWTDLQVDGVPTSITSGIGLVPKNKRVKIKLNAN
jgi:hypothetical protein